MADKSSTQASKPRTLTVDDQDRDFLKQIQELNVKGNEKLKEIQQDPTLSWKDPAEQIDTILANSEAAVEQYNKVIKSSQEALSAVTTANSAIRLKEREKTAFLVAEVQFDVELMGHDVEADTEKLRRIFKAKPFLLKALDTESANDIRKDVEEQLRRSQERVLLSIMLACSITEMSAR
jgi:FlaA1/EpsC-like NDP-sugar epimerase